MIKKVKRRSLTKQEKEFHTSEVDSRFFSSQKNKNKLRQSFRHVVKHVGPTPFSMGASWFSFISSRKRKNVSCAQRRAHSKLFYIGDVNVVSSALVFALWMDPFVVVTFIRIRIWHYVAFCCCLTWEVRNRPIVKLIEWALREAAVYVDGLKVVVQRRKLKPAYQMGTVHFIQCRVCKLKTLTLPKTCIIRIYIFQCQGWY